MEKSATGKESFGKEGAPAGEHTAGHAERENENI